MYEADHVVKIQKLATQLAQELANAYAPNADRICQICQAIESSTLAVYEFARGIQGDDHGQN